MAWSWFWGIVTDEQPVQIARYTKEAVIFPTYVIPRAAGDFPPPPPATEPPEKHAEWAAKYGGVDAGVTELRVTVTGTSSAPVILHGLRIRILEQKPPIEGTHVLQGGGDISAIRWIEVDLDAHPPRITKSVDGRNNAALVDPEYEEQPEKPVTFPYEVSATKTEVFWIIAKTEKCYCTWTAELLWTTGETEGSTVIDNEGEPFQTTSTKNATRCEASWTKREFVRCY